MRSVFEIFRYISLLTVCKALIAPSGFGQTRAVPSGEVWISPPRPAQVWDAKPPAADAPSETVRGRIVQFRHSNARGGAETERVDYEQRYAPDGSATRWEDVLNFDVDGNPDTKDWVQTIRFSLKDPLSPSMPLWEDDLIGTRFYGGFSFYYSKRQPSDGGVTEKYVNNNEQVNNMQPANDWALHHQPTKVPSTPFRCYASWIWKKADFGCGANEAPAKVSFDKSSRLGLYTQRYWQGWEAVRFVVMDGAQLYVSEPMPNDWKESSGGSGRFQLRTLVPSQSKWGKWNPPEGDFKMEFDPATPMEPHEFTDVQAVGWYLYKDQLNADSVAFKWESFECYANVTRPARPSLNVPMTEVKSGTPLFISNVETPYDLWRKIVKWSDNRGQWGLQPRQSTYDSYGDMGSMKFGNQSHSQAEPVTDITLYDALVYLNALSEYEGREPVYYTDPSFSRPSEYEYVRQDGKTVAEAIIQKSKDTVFRQAVWSPFNGDEKLKARPAIYVKWDADGFRLPTPAEWTAAAGGQKTADKGQTTKPVGSGSPNEAGLYDMFGNVWELVWTYGDKMEPDPAEISVMGGAFYAGDPLKVSASPYGDKPYGGRFDIGFRPVRRHAGLSAPPAAIKPQSSELPLWKIKKSDKTAAFSPEPLGIKFVKVPDGKIKFMPEKKKITDVEMTSFEMQDSELSYREWKKIYFWALDKGYTFDRYGQMGSMFFKSFINEHSPDEPVTGISFYDALVCANALSEMQGRPHIFFSDAACTAPYKNAWRWRPLEYRNIDHYVFATSRVVKGFSAARPNVYMKWDSDGFRLPTLAEWMHANAAGSTTEYSWGDKMGSESAGVGEFSWYLGNSGYRTHEVKTKKPNAFGLFDTTGNALEMTVDSFIKGGRFVKGQTKNPVAETTPYKQHDHGRVLFARTGFMYHSRDGFASSAPLGEHGIWAGCSAGVNYPDVGFRLVAAEKGAYPKDGVDPAIKEYFSTPLTNALSGYDPLQGATYRGNLMRDGNYRTVAPAALSKKWEFKTGAAVKASPVVVGGVLYVGSGNGSFYALDAVSGAVKWSFKTGGPVYTTATVSDGAVFFVSMDGKLYALDAKSGAKKWEQVVSDKKYQFVSPGVAYGLVFVSQGVDCDFENIGWGGSRLLGFDVVTGQKVWEQKESSGPDGFNSMAIIEGKMIFVSWDYGRVIDLASGMCLWNNRITKKPLSGLAYSTAAVQDGVMYQVFAVGGAAAGDSRMADFTGCDIAKGKEIFYTRPYNEFKAGSSKPADDLDHRSWAPVALADGLGFIGNSDGYLYAMDLKTGKLQWKFNAGDKIRSGPSYAGGLLFFGCDNGRVYALDARTGSLKSQLPLADKTMSSPCIANGMLFIGDDSGTVFGFE
jgi:outer membrane protein assembly factor BamB/formylglycine-generating enzyme required for sulfatase activity